MIGVDRDIDRLFCRESGDQRRVDTFRVGNRHAGVEADDRDMRNAVERPDQRTKPPRREQERIAAGDDDLPDLLVAADVTERRVKLGDAQLLVAAPDLLAPEAEAAIDRAE